MNPDIPQFKTAKIFFLNTEALYFEKIKISFKSLNAL